MASITSKEAEATSSGTGSSPVLPVVHHTPMSERQQLALIKKLERAQAATSNGGKKYYFCVISDYHTLFSACSVIYVRVCPHFSTLWSGNPTKLVLSL